MSKFKYLINSFLMPISVFIISGLIGFISTFFLYEYPKAIARIDMLESATLANKQEIIEQRSEIVDELKEIRQTQRDIINILIKKGLN